MTKIKTRYKFLLPGYRSGFGGFRYKFGKWYKHDGKLEMCKSGFHCSKGIYQAFSYVTGSILARVEVRGKSIMEDDKEVWEEMRIVKSWRWPKRDNVLFAIYAARLVLPNFEKEYPADNRPRKAIEAAENWVANPIKKNGLVAWFVAWSATDPADSARSTASAAVRSAAWSIVGSVAESAAFAAKSAAESAASAKFVDSVGSARSAISEKLDKWMLGHLKELKVLRGVKQ